MAGRFLFQKLSSRMSGSTSLLCARASASARDVTPLTRHASAARHLNALPCSCSAPKTSSPITGMPSVITDLTKPVAFDDCVRGVKRTFSFSSSTKDTVDWVAARAACLAELEAKKAALSEAENAAIIADIAAHEAKNKAQKEASDADLKEWKAKIDKDAAEFNLLVTCILGFFSALGLYGVVAILTEYTRVRKGESSPVGVPMRRFQNPNAQAAASASQCGSSES